MSTDTAERVVGSADASKASGKGISSGQRKPPSTPGRRTAVRASQLGGPRPGAAGQRATGTLHGAGVRVMRAQAGSRPGLGPAGVVAPEGASELQPGPLPLPLPHPLRNNSGPRPPFLRCQCSPRLSPHCLRSPGLGPNAVRPPPRRPPPAARAPRGRPSAAAGTVACTASPARLPTGSPGARPAAQQRPRALRVGNASWRPSWKVLWEVLCMGLLPLCPLGPRAGLC